MEDVAAAIADQLGEAEALPRRQIRRAVQALGAERAQALLAEVLAIEAGGGELLPDGSRRRTPGGVFFRRLRAQCPPEEVRAILWPVGRRPRGGGGDGPRAPAAPAFTWDDYGALAPTLTQGAGEATTVKITVIGRPKQVRAQGEVVIVPLVSEKLPTIPKGLPTPAAGTAYAVLIAKKQWQKVAGVTDDPEDRLIIEGYPTLDPRFPGITVLATNVTTRNLQMAKRAAQAGQGG
jgi:hypothetical protein